MRPAEPGAQCGCELKPSRISNSTGGVVRTLMALLASRARLFRGELVGVAAGVGGASAHTGDFLFLFSRKRCKAARAAGRLSRLLDNGI